MSRTHRSSIALLLLAVLSLAAAPAAHAALPPGGTFLDDNGSKFEGAIEAIAAEGITSGCGIQVFCPEGLVTRGQMATFLVRALNLPASATNYFTDDNGSVHESNINRLRAAGVTAGCGGSRFCPEGLVTRGQMATFLVRGFELPSTPTDYFTDDNANLHEANINRLRASGITSGCGGSSFCPNGIVTRGQMAAFLQRAMGLALIVPPPPVAGNPTGHSAIPPEARAVDTSAPGPGGRQRDAGQLHLAGRRQCRRARRGHHLQLRPEPGHHPDERDGARSSTTGPTWSSTAAAV